MTLQWPLLAAREYLLKYKIQKYFVKHKNICSLGPPSLNNKTSLSDAEDEEGWEEADTASRMAAVYQAQGDFQPKPVGSRYREICLI